MRHRLRTYEGLGFGGFTEFLLGVDGHSFCLITNLIFWLRLLLHVFKSRTDLSAEAGLLLTMTEASQRSSDGSGDQSA